jgi:hypothetical protein
VPAQRRVARDLPGEGGLRSWVRGPLVRLAVGDDGDATISWRAFAIVGPKREARLVASQLRAQRTRGRGRTRGVRIDHVGGEVYYLWCPAGVREQVDSVFGAVGAAVIDGEFLHDWLRTGLENYRSRRDA